MNIMLKDVKGEDSIKIEENRINYNSFFDNSIRINK